MWSLDGTALKVGGPILTPDLNAVDGTLSPSPGTKYALAVNGVRLQAPIVARKKNAVLYRIDGKPLKLQEALVGRQTDGWMVGTSDDPVARASYTRYDVSADNPGLALVRLTRIGWCPKPGLRQTGKVTVRIGPVGIGPDKQPRIERVTETRHFDVRDCEANADTLTPPNVPWRMEITVAPTFVPKEIDPSSSEARELGAVDRRGRVPAALQPLTGRGDEVREAPAEREACEWTAALERLRGCEDRPWQRHGLRDEERSQLDRREAGCPEILDDVVDAVLPRVEVEDHLLVRVLSRAAEEHRAITRVVDGAEDGRRRDRARRLVVVEVADVDFGAAGESHARGLHHLLREVDASVAEPAREQRLSQPAVAAREIEHLVPRFQPRSERRDQRGAMGEIRGDVRVRVFRPVRRLPRVLVLLRAHSASRRSGCLRTKRAIPRACHSVWRDRNRSSITAA